MTNREMNLRCYEVAIEMLKLATPPDRYAGDIDEIEENISKIANKLMDAIGPTSQADAELRARCFEMAIETHKMQTHGYGGDLVIIEDFISEKANDCLNIISPPGPSESNTRLITKREKQSE